MNKAIFSTLGIILGILLITTTVSAVTFESLRASKGNITNVAQFNNFEFQKVSFSSWTRITNLTNQEYVGGAGLQLLGVTPLGNRVLININSDLYEYEEEDGLKIYVYKGDGTYKSGNLLPQQRRFLLVAIYDPITNTISLYGFSWYPSFVYFKVQEMNVISLK